MQIKTRSILQTYLCSAALCLSCLTFSEFDLHKLDVFLITKNGFEFQISKVKSKTQKFHQKIVKKSIF
jgi:hypothetical protein